MNVRVIAFLSLVLLGIYSAVDAQPTEYINFEPGIKIDVRYVLADQVTQNCVQSGIKLLEEKLADKKSDFTKAFRLSLADHIIFSDRASPFFSIQVSSLASYGRQPAGAVLAFRVVNGKCELPTDEVFQFTAEDALKRLNVIIPAFLKEFEKQKLIFERYSAGLRGEPLIQD